ncbi:hypothetical protein [Thiocapsa sp. N5-Cardenillas]|uniref:hypothetical protein n=1 Tax=Thiocapsa sp. N5-Cardenillas TaxID=3137397 RepID=UPI0035B02D51
MIASIDLPLAMWFIAPGMRYHYAGGSQGPYGDTLDSIVLEQVGPPDEPLLSEKPTDQAVLLAALQNCQQYPTVFNWQLLPENHAVAVQNSEIIVSSHDLAWIVIRSGDNVILSEQANSPTVQFSPESAGDYKIHLFYITTMKHGSTSISSHA